MAGLHSNYPRPDWMDDDSGSAKGSPAAVVLLREHGRRVRSLRLRPRTPWLAAS